MTAGIALNRASVLPAASASLSATAEPLSCAVIFPISPTCWAKCASIVRACKRNRTVQATISTTLQIAIVTMVIFC